MSTGTLAQLSQDGDTRLHWDTDNPDEVAAAKAMFDSLTAKGYLAYRTVGADDTRGEQIRRFDPAAEQIVLVPALQGG